ncbi:hypothetical protein J6590_065291 [Homalodisca vitripennis]|nr:hypothetical protein J6590_065291 [Homalodisca vitripennis]
MGFDVSTIDKYQGKQTDHITVVEQINCYSIQDVTVHYLEKVKTTAIEGPLNLTSQHNKHYLRHSIEDILENNEICSTNSEVRMHGFSREEKVIGLQGLWISQGKPKPVRKPPMSTRILYSENISGKSSSTKISTTTKELTLEKRPQEP